MLSVICSVTVIPHLTLSILVPSADKGRAWSRSKLFDTLTPFVLCVFFVLFFNTDVEKTAEDKKTQNYTGDKEFENKVQRHEMYTQIKRQLKKPIVSGSTLITIINCS